MANFKIELNGNYEWLLTVSGDGSDGDMKTACKIITFFDKKLTTFELDKEEFLKSAK